jgi:predicted RNA-binding protein with RPS1 domain
VIYTGKVVKVVDFGAFVNFLGLKDGLVHISELANERVGKVTDVVNEGDEVKVKVLGVDDRGKVKLSMKVVDQETGVHKVIPDGERIRGKRTRAKERVYKYINTRIRSIHPNFNIGITTGTKEGREGRWSQPYRHWRFVPSESEIIKNSGKRK